MDIKIWCPVISQFLRGSCPNCLLFLLFQDPPSLPSFTWKPVNRTAVEGGRETFYCTATGSPSPTITWSKLGGSIPADRRQEPSPGSLRIIDLQPGDDGIYICTASNFLGNVTAQAFLHIQGDLRQCGFSIWLWNSCGVVQIYWLFQGQPLFNTCTDQSLNIHVPMMNGIHELILYCI